MDREQRRAADRQLTLADRPALSATHARLLALLRQAVLELALSARKLEVRAVDHKRSLVTLAVAQVAASVTAGDKAAATADDPKAQPAQVSVTIDPQAGTALGDLVLDRKQLHGPKHGHGQGRHVQVQGPKQLRALLHVQRHGLRRNRLGR